MMNDKNFVRVCGIGSYVPERVLTNDDLSKIVDTSDEWIRTRTGIIERRIADKEEFTSDLCTSAGRLALFDAGLPTVDLILVGTVTPDMLFPATAAIVQKNLGLSNIPCIDYNAACSGFQYGTELARSLLLGSDLYKTVLLICGDKMSSVLDWSDRSTSVLLGDGAGAVVFSRDDSLGGGDSSIVDVMLGANGELSDLIMLPAGGSREPTTEETVKNKRHFFKMSGRDVFREAVKTMGNCAHEILERNNMSIADIDFVIPHQANLRIIEAIGERLKIPASKMCITVHKYGNTSASSSIIALDELKRDGKIKKDSKILTVSFGAGLTWGASILSF